MIGVDELLALILAEVEPLRPIRHLIDLVIGSVLAGDLVAVDPLPPFTNSAMDGFAIRRVDRERVASFRVVDDLAAGHESDRQIAGGEAARIATGAMLPAGADAVVPIELATVRGDHVSFQGKSPPHGHVRAAGEDVAVGTILARSGDRLTPALACVAMAAGVRAAWVVPIPRVGIITTGDELVALNAPLALASVRDVNAAFLASAVAALGMAPVDLGRSPDNPDAIGAAISTRVGGLDAIVVAGGLGPGPRDVVVEAISRLGTARAFHVAMRPGKAFAFGQVRNLPIFGVPGNPGATLAAFHALVVPSLRALAGRPPHAPEVHAMLTTDVPNDGGRRTYLRVTLSWDGPTLMATPTGRHGSGLISDLAAADAFLVIPSDRSTARSGTALPILPLTPLGGF